MLNTFCKEKMKERQLCGLQSLWTKSPNSWFLPQSPEKCPERDQMYQILLCTLNTPLEKITTLFTIYCHISQAEKTLDVSWQNYHENLTYLWTAGTRQTPDGWMWWPAFACQFWQKHEIYSNYQGWDTLKKYPTVRNCHIAIAMKNLWCCHSYVHDALVSSPQLAIID